MTSQYTMNNLTTHIHTQSLSLTTQTTLFNNNSSKVVQVVIIILVQTDAYHITELYDHIAS